MTKLSKTLQAMLSPLTSLIGLPDSLAMAIKKCGKRGNKSHYPSDLTRNKVILESVHDVTGKVFSVMVIAGNFAQAIQDLSAMVQAEDYYIEQALTYVHNDNAINFLKQAELV